MAAALAFAEGQDQEIKGQILGWAKAIRANTEPSLFEYAERRSRGEEPPPDNRRWPRSLAQRKRDSKIVQFKVMERKDGHAIFNEVDYEKAYTGRNGKR